jgi:predicted transcriptional regulator
MKQIFEKLSELGVPVHDLRYRDKAPIDNDWQLNRSRILTCADNSNIGIRCGASIGFKNDLYCHIIDIDSTPTPEMLSIIKDIFPRKERFIERSGGKNRGLHTVFTSHLPLPSCVSKSKLKTEFYGLDNHYNFRNVCIAPSFVKSQYIVWDEDTKEWGHGDDLIIKSWEYIIKRPIDEQSWLKLMKLVVPDALLDEKVFIFMFTPLIKSDDFNYRFFGEILSATAIRLNFPIPKLMSWTETLLKTLPDGLRDDKTIKMILKYQEDTLSRKTKEDDIPGFPTIDQYLTEQIAIQRGYTDNFDTKGLVTRAVIWYKKTIEEIFRDIPHEERVPVIDDASIATFFNTKFVDAIDAAANFCLEDNFVFAGSVLLFFGVEGSGKSFLLQDMTTAATTGTSFWDGRYTFKEPIIVLNIYGDKSRSIHKKLYIDRFHKKHDDSKIHFIYTHNLYADLKHIHVNPFIFDMSDKETLTFIEKSIKHIKPKLVIVDNISSCILSGDINDGKFVKPLMSKLRTLAIDNKCCIILVHHSNKRNAKETRGKSLFRDDFQGSVQWSGQSDTSFFCYPKQEKDKIIKNEGNFKFGKGGVLADYENFDYKIINEYPEVDGKRKHTVRIEFFVPTDDIDDEKLKISSQLLEILKLIVTPIKSTDLRSKLDIGNSSDISPRQYKRRIEDLKESGYIISKGKTSSIEYTITQKGQEFLNSNIPEVSNG